MFPVIDPANVKPLNDEGCDWPERMRRDHAHSKDRMLPYWLSLAPAYAKTLARPLGGDTGYLKTHVPHWPASFDAQQVQLHHLLSISKLGQGYTPGLPRCSMRRRSSRCTCWKKPRVGQTPLRGTAASAC